VAGLTPAFAATASTVGRVALVGDAAYCASPASGAGAELALVGAYRLAGELAGGDHELAFRRYQEGLGELVRRKQQIGAHVRLMAPKTRTGRIVRNTLARSRVIAAAERLARPKAPLPLPGYPAAIPATG
jgi:2-polyprenyl-6-methoxyphenol hydroxylase-like FAD-dependent oxidoreductase